MLKLSLLLLIAQIGDFVALLSERIAEASHSNRHNPQCPEIAQLTMCIHVSSFPPVKSSCRYDMRFTSCTTWRSEPFSVQIGNKCSQIHSERLL